LPDFQTLLQQRPGGLLHIPAHKTCSDGHPDVVAHALLQPSMFNVFPSSHCSPFVLLRIPSPHTAFLQALVQELESSLSPSSHSSVPPTIPSPHTGQFKHPFDLFGSQRHPLVQTLFDHTPSPLQVSTAVLPSAHL